MELHTSELQCCFSLLGSWGFELFKHSAPNHCYILYHFKDKLSRETSTKPLSLHTHTHTHTPIPPIVHKHELLSIRLKFLILMGCSYMLEHKLKSVQLLLSNQQLEKHQNVCLKTLLVLITQASNTESPSCHSELSLCWVWEGSHKNPNRRTCRSFLSRRRGQTTSKKHMNGVRWQ